MSERPAAIVAGHGGFAAGIVSAVEQVTGMAGCFVPVTNAGLSPAGIDEALRRALAESGARLIFTDLPAGSCTMAARRLAKEDPGLVVVTGVALPTLLAYACGSGVPEAVESGRKAMQLLEAPRAP